MGGKIGGRSDGLSLIFVIFNLFGICFLIFDFKFLT